ncbi:MAG: Spy/CpxP family protein refolding chaperone [Deltaproteobacteria bacterium]
MLSKLFWKISAAMFIGFGILLTGCAKDDPSSEEVNAVIAERLDLTEEQAARVQPVTAQIWAERETFRTLRTGLYEQILVQLKNESVDQEELQNMLYTSWNQMEPMIPKAVNAFSEYHAVLNEEKRNELSEKLENRRERITQGRRGFWRFSDEEPTAEEINGKIADRLDLTPEQETEMLPLTEKLLIEREEIQQVRLSIFDEVIVQLNNESADTTRLESNLRSGWNAIHQRIPLAVETIASVHAILTEEQRAEIVEKMERRKDRREKRRQRRWHHWY